MCLTGHTFLDMLSLVHALLALIPEGAEQASAGPCTHNHAVSPPNTREKEEADKEKASSGESKSEYFFYLQKKKKNYQRNLDIIRCGICWLRKCIITAT